MTVLHALLTAKYSRTPLGHCFSLFDAARLHLRLSRTSLILLSRSGRIFLRTPSVVSLGAGKILLPANLNLEYMR